MVIAKCLNCGDIPGIFMIMAFCASFHFSTLEEYYTGSLMLGPGNGVSDGSFGVISMMIVMSVIGNDFWSCVVFDF